MHFRPRRRAIRRAAVALLGLVLLAGWSSGAIYVAENTDTGQHLMARLADEAGR